KLRLILAALSANYAWIAALVLGASVVEAVYYIRLIHLMWFKGEGEKMEENFVLGVIMVLLVAAIIIIGVYPGPVWNIVQKAGSDLFNVANYVKNVPLLGVSP
ncbi:proton-conducting membrane transporter, partial [Thermococci archaeon]